MKPFTLHPGSVLLGLVLAAVLAVLVGAQSPGTVHPIPIREARLVGEIPADWWVRIRLNTDGGSFDTYTVPSNRYLVIALTDSIGILADGQDLSAELRPFLYTSSQANGARFVVPPGVQLSSQLSVVRIWGYLEPVQ